MLQREFAKVLDGISYAYMGARKGSKPRVFHDCTLGEYLETHAVSDPYEFFANAGRTPEVTVRAVSARMGYSLTRFHFKSLVRTPHPENNTVHCRLYEINGRPDAPAVVVLHGWQMESYAFFDYYCRFLVRQGFNAALVDLPYHMRRRAHGSHHGQYTFSDDAVLTLKVMKQSVSDVQCVINWLKSRGAERVGAFGVSYGGMLTGLVGCAAPDLDFMMCVVPPANLFEFFTNTPLGREFAKRNPRMYAEVQQHRDVFERISIENMTPKMPPEKIFLVMAEYDGMVSPEALDRLWKAWQRPYYERYVHGHLSVILFNPSMSHHMRRWLRDVMKP
jgi:pimeloyl-ACP methyl ester carboxylesterase